MKSSFAAIHCACYAAALLGAAGSVSADSSNSHPELAAFVLCGEPMPPLSQFAEDAVSGDSCKAALAIQHLRGRGPDGLRALLETHAATLKEHETNRVLALAKLPPDESWQRLKTALDGVSGQRDCYASHLYWYTDFEQAKVAARNENKPILSLRLLGKLDEEFSCANSRFFRTTLYANKEIAAYLNDHFILHWKSVRPVPKVTIDFGDGRKLERTLTGNSIHYVLDADGRVIDALPGLYGPQAFLRELQRIDEVALNVSKLSEEPRALALREFHRTRLDTLTREYATDLQRIANVAPVRVDQLASTSSTLAPTAQAAGKRATGKGLVETPILRRTTPGGLSPQSPPEDALWERIGELHADTARVDERSSALMRTKSPSAITAGRLTGSKIRVEDPLLRQVRNLERSISEDTVRNEYLFHTKIHEWLIASGPSTNLDGLNQRVYAELFLTPDSDPWLGLLPADTYAALENGGITMNPSQQQQPVK